VNIDWSSIGSQLAKLGLPLLGGSLGGPPGAAIGVALASYLGKSKALPEEVLQTIQQSSDDFLKAQQFEAAHQETLLRLQIDAAVASAQAVNVPMQAETLAEKWPQYSWGPTIGFSASILLLGNYLILPLAHLPVSQIPSEAWLFIGGVLGVASWWRGKEKSNGANRE